MHYETSEEHVSGTPATASPLADRVKMAGPTLLFGPAIAKARPYGLPARSSRSI
ncbi:MULTISPECIES: hypothetical protein [unclassified Streptomyces]|uniref:hypothetical protein n=1 Tax=unclassified Streptomyces TaxID=2593676 RepID=UPI001655656D|nr:hypothetical protein [Streptomyces sp. CB02980]MCB8901173.1 hypothetical protein [Streptomyces sp. CB02980]